MGFLFGGNKTKPQYTGLATQTSTSALPITLAWGRNRIAPNILDQDDFQSHKHSAGGKGGGGKGGTYTYSGSFILGICWGVITGVGVVYKDQSVTTLSALGMSLFTGTTPQTPWSYWTTNHAAKALGYAGVAYAAIANYDLGGSNALSQHSFETFAPLYNTQVDGNGDADPAQVVADFLSNATYGVGLDSTYLTNVLSTGAATTTGDNAYQTYCQAMGFGMSPVLSGLEAGGTTLLRWADLTNTALVWPGYALKFIPYGTETVTAHGVTYLPNFPVVYTLTDDDFITADGSDPVTFDRQDLSQVDNQISITIANRANQYNDLPVPWIDQGLIDQYGPRSNNNITAKEITEPAMAAQMVALYGQRLAYSRNTFQFVLGPAYVLIEPMDVLTIVDARMGSHNVQVIEIEEGEDGNFTIHAVEFNGSVNTLGLTNTQAATSTNINTAEAAGPVNPPVLFEPPSSLAGSAQVWAAVSGGDGTTADPTWGGCFVWISTDNATYTQIGEIKQPARQGKLTASLATYGGSPPDASHTLAVTLAMSGGDLISASSGADAAAGSTLAYVDGELIGPQTATLTGTNAYNLTNLYRGLYGSTVGAHSSGTQYARLDEAIFKYDLPAAYIGTTLYLKFQSYNVYGGGLQDLSVCTAYTVTPSGAGFGTGSSGVPSAPTGLSATAGNAQVALKWNANAANDNVTAYEVWRAAGTGASFGSANKIATLAALAYTDTDLAASTGYTYFLKAENAAGASTNTAGVNATTTSAAFSNFLIKANNLSDVVSASTARGNLGAAASGDAASSGITTSTNRIIGRLTASTGALEELTATQVTAFLNQFSTSLQGLVPASGGGTTNFLRADGSWASPGAGSGTVTTTGSPVSGNLAKFSGATSITAGDLSGDVTTSGALVTTIAANAVTTSKINNSAVTLAKIANAAASSVLLGSSASGVGSAYSEILLGTGVSMVGSTLTVSGGSGGIGNVVEYAPTVVQKTSIAANSFSVTLGSAPTAGNILLWIGTHFTNSPTLAANWTQILSNNGTADGFCIAYKVAQSGESTTQAAYSSSPGGTNGTMYELSQVDFSALNYFTTNSTGAATSIAITIIPPKNNCLIVGFVGDTTHNETPTVTGATAGTTVTGTSTNDTPRSTTPFSQAGTKSSGTTITGTFATSSKLYIAAVCLFPLLDT